VGAFALLASACGDAEAPAPTSAASESVGSPTPPEPPRAPFVFATAGACDLLSNAQVAGAFGVPSVESSEGMRPREHRKVCRYTWMSGDVQASLTLDVEAKREGPAAASFERALTARREGLPVTGREGVVQRFEQIHGIGDEAYYSGNVADSKSLFARFGDRYVVSLQHELFGQDTGDLQPQFFALVRQVARKLAD
jgi:hypothetical protein